MGRIIHQNNGKTTIFTSGEDISTVTPISDTYYVGVDLNTGFFEKRNPDGSLINLEQDLTGGTNTTIVTYSELVTLIGSNGLEVGSYYLISDFQTIYDQPDYYVNSTTNSVNPRSCITKYGPIEPLMVLAISSNTISDMSFQPSYPKDKIKYDWSWSNTEINGTPTKGRITERIDEYNNRTDYDHRSVQFKRYETYNLSSKLTGTIGSYDSSTGILTSNGDTSFTTEVNPGDIIYIDSIPSYNFKFSIKVSGVTDNNTLVSYIDPTFNSFSVGGTFDFYSTTPSGNYLSFKEFYIGQSDLSGYTEMTTFQLDGTTYDNYIGDFSQYNTSLSPISINNYGYNTHFILSNNVFGVNTYSNRISDLCVNNSTGSNFYRNRIYQQFFNNIISNNFQNNDIGSGFNNNYVNDNFVGNTILNGFAYNNIFSTSSYRNVIYNGFYANKIYHYFSENNFGNNFNTNKIGSLTSLNSSSFDDNTFISNTYQNTFDGYVKSNIVGENFSYNTLDNNFSYNRIGTNFTYNVIGTDFGYGGSNYLGNTIGDYFANNTIGNLTYSNVIGNYFTNNTIGDNFENNTIKNYFLYNTILNGFESNNIGDYFGNNGTAPGSPIQNFIGDNFKYNNIGNFFGNDTNFPSVSGGTNGDGGNVIANDFQFNTIGDNFIYNVTDNIVDYNNIGHDAWLNYFGSNTRHNTIGDLFVGNTGLGGFGSPLGVSFISNKLSNYSAFNAIGDNFQYNSIGDFFGNSGVSNSIANDFNNNKIGNYFGDDGTHTSGGNNITNNFYDNLIGNKFYNNTIGDYLINNQINGRFNSNTTSTGFMWNVIDTDIAAQDFSVTFSGNILTFSYASSGTYTDGSYTNVTGTTNSSGSGAEFTIDINGGSITAVTISNVGYGYMSTTNYFTETITLDSSQYGGGDNIVIYVEIVDNPSVYQPYTCDIFERQGGTKRLSYYDSSDTLTITNINE